MGLYGTTKLNAIGMAAVLVGLAPCALASVDVAGLDATTDGFCARAQQLIAGTGRIAANQVQREYEAFLESQSRPDPLTTQQYVLYEDDRHTLPLRVSCKMQTADRLAAERGEDSASAPEGSCADLHRAIVAQVHASLSDADRALVRVTPQQILLMPDEVTRLESGWTAPFDFAWFDADGVLHLQAKALRIDWQDKLWSWAPESLRGLHYCHVIAPEYLRRLMMGEQSVPRLPPTEPQ